MALFKGQCLDTVGETRETQSHLQAISKQIPKLPPPSVQTIVCKIKIFRLQTNSEQTQKTGRKKARQTFALGQKPWTKTVFSGQMKEKL